REYFGGLEQHLQAVAKTIHSVLPRHDEPVPYLLVEDFGTRGLTGDPHIDPELDADGDEQKNDFFYFWRNVGRSNKGEIDRGRWGLGKAVFTVASRIRTIFGLTRRADDNRGLLLGQSVLKTHVQDGERIYPYGFFARYERRNGLPLPIEDPILLDRFADDFGVRRLEPGLSIVVPYYRDDELSFERILRSAVHQYFYPILRGDLVAEVADHDRQERLSAATIEAIASREPAVARLCELTRWSLAQQEHVTLPEQGVGAPKWDESLFDAAQLAALRDRFAAGERLAFRVPLLVKRKRARAAASWFDVYLERDDELRRGEHHFIRRGITIPDVRTNGDKAARSLVVIDHDPLSTFLGDAENPAHSDWSERADKIRTLYDHGAWTLRFVKHSAAFLTSLLARPAEGRVRDFLADVFWVEAPEEPPRPATLDRLPIRAGAPEANEEASSGVAITRIAGGFTIKGEGPRTLRAEVAYRVRAGNPFRKHSPFDFDLLTPGGIGVYAEGAAVRPTSTNAVELVAGAAKFQISMKGFDPRRDLVVRVVDAADAAEAELH
ncbi:MAG TPA: hypothetical protein VJ276_05935, partial [Thermoanaerobaculia bacterium]|nr:hypothetical protein [Thermoanaerobaculia bacterium]